MRYAVWRISPIFGSFGNYEIVVCLIGSSIDDMCVGVVEHPRTCGMQGIFFAHLSDEGVLANDKHIVVFAHQGDILLYQLLIFLSEAELVDHVRPVLLDGPGDALADACELVVRVRHGFADHRKAQDQKNCEQEVMEVFLYELYQVVHLTSHL